MGSEFDMLYLCDVPRTGQSHHKSGKLNQEAAGH